MLTAKGREIEVAKGVALGADAYVTKPFSTRELSRRSGSCSRRGERAMEEGEGEASADRRRRVTMFSPISAFCGRPLTVPLEATVRETLEAMERAGRRARSSSPTGARRSARHLHAAGPGAAGDAPRRRPAASRSPAVMTGGLVTLRPHATAHQAALTMARNGVRHVVVVDGEGRLAGVVSQDELFGAPADGRQQVSDASRRPATWRGCSAPRSGSGASRRASSPTASGSRRSPTTSRR